MSMTVDCVDRIAICQDRKLGTGGFCLLQLSRIRVDGDHAQVEGPGITNREVAEATDTPDGQPLTRLEIGFAQTTKIPSRRRTESARLLRRRFRQAKGPRNQNR